MNRKWLVYIIIGLIAIGFLTSLINNPRGYIIPVIIFGLIFYFLKFPPKGGFRLPNWFSKHPSGYNPRPKKKRKHSFKVIPGSKHKENNDPPDMPKYH